MIIVIILIIIKKIIIILIITITIIINNTINSDNYNKDISCISNEKISLFATL